MLIGSKEAWDVAVQIKHESMSNEDRDWTVSGHVDVVESGSSHLGRPLVWASGRELQLVTAGVALKSGVLICTVLSSANGLFQPQVAPAEE